MFFSNRIFCFPIEAGARRPMIIKSSTKYLAKEQGGTLTASEKHMHFSHLIEKVLKNNDYQYAFLRYLKKEVYIIYESCGFKKRAISNLI